MLIYFVDGVVGFYIVRGKTKSVGIRSPIYIDISIIFELICSLNIFVYKQL